MDAFDEHKTEKERLERIRAQIAQWPEAPTEKRLASLPEWARTYMAKLNASVQTLRAVGEGVGLQGLQTRVTTAVEAWGDGEGLGIPEHSEIRFESHGLRNTEIAVKRATSHGRNGQTRSGAIEVRTNSGRLVVVHSAGNCCEIVAVNDPEKSLAEGFFGRQPLVVQLALL